MMEDIKNLVLGNEKRIVELLKERIVVNVYCNWFLKFEFKEKYKVILENL